MILLYISAYSRNQNNAGGVGGGTGGGGGGASGSGSGSSSSSAAHQRQHKTPEILNTLKLGISILRGGNTEVQRRMLKHLKAKKDVGFFISIQSLMNSCSVLDLDAFERNQKAEALGVRSEGTASEKNMHDAELTCKLFRFFQLLCEGHNLEFQNYLRTQAGNTTTVNVVISTVDYLLRLQESIMDFYWHYSSKDVIDPSGTENFIKAITIAKQVFNTLTESIQGPCSQNQQALAHSRLWHAVGGFLFLFAHMQDKLSRNSSQLGLLIELLDLQKEMVIMMLSMLEGNVVNGTIGKQMLDLLVEASANVEIILKFFDMFLRLPRLTSSTNFQEYDKTGSGWISASDLKKAMEQHKIYTPEETQYLLSCCEPNHDGMIDYREFIDRFHQPVKDIGFNLAVLLTNLAEHMTNEPRLHRFLETASTVLNYFEPYLGRIEIMGSSKRIERVYFEIKESTINQWGKPQIQESKRAFFYSIVTEGDGKEKLEAFVNFCEDTIFEMQHASNILGEEEEEAPTKAKEYPFAGDTSASVDAATSVGGSPTENVKAEASLGKMCWSLFKSGVILLFTLLVNILAQLQPTRIKRRYHMLRSMTYGQLVKGSFRLLFKLAAFCARSSILSTFATVRFIFYIMVNDSSVVSSSNNPLVQNSNYVSNQQSATWNSGSSGYGPTARQMNGRKQMDLSSSNRNNNNNNNRQGFDYHEETRRKKSGLITTINGSTSSVQAATTATTLDSNGNFTRREIVTEPAVMKVSATEIHPAITGTQQQSPAAASPTPGQPQLATSQQVGGGASVVGDETDLYAANSDDDNNANRRVSAQAAMSGKQNQYMDIIMSKPIISDQLDNTDDNAGSQMLYDGYMNNNNNNPFISVSGVVSGNDGSDATSNDTSRAPSFIKISQLFCYNQKIISFLARNFYRIKLLALVTAFVINFILLFYKVSSTSTSSVWDDNADGFMMNIVADDQQENSDATTTIIDHINNYQQQNDYQSLQNDTDSDELSGLVDSLAITGNSIKHDDSSGTTANNADEDDEDSMEWVIMEEKYYYLQPLLTFLACVHSLFSFCMLLAYYHLKVPLVIFKREKEIARKLEFDGIYIAEEPADEDWWNGHWDKLVISADSFPVNYWDKFVKKRVREKYSQQYDYESLSNLLGMDKTSSMGGQQSSSKFSLPDWLSWFTKVDWRYQLWKAGVTLTDQSFQYQLLYLIFSLAGHLNYFFFAAHLLDVAVGFKKLRTILQSVTHNGRQLLLTVMLLTIVVYIYTVIAFNFFRKFYVQGDDSPDQKCHSMMTCFVYHLYQGVRAGGGIGDVIEAPDGDDYEVYRIIFDITFFFFVIVILLAIIQGLIIDAFGELRDQLLTVAADMESNCFICGIGKDVLDKVPRGFDTHVQKEHNLANYMFFLMHLINKPDTDYTGQETYVWELYQRRCWDFFPVGECFRTQSEEENEAGKSAKKD